jgi:hypothetical protein
MGSAGKRGRAGRRGPLAEPLADQVERAGHVVLTSIWSAVVWIVRMLFLGGARGGAAAFAWFRRQRREVQLVMVGLLAGASLAAAHVITTRPPPPVYVDDEGEALARVIRSEAGIGSPQQRIHVAWATRNLATERRQSIAEMACSPCGPQQLGRPVSSRQDASDLDRELARHILASPAAFDPTGGATHFINPLLQDDLAARGAPGYRGRPYNEVRQRWIGTYGWEPYYRLGPDLELWGPKRAARGKKSRSTSRASSK